MPWRLPQSVPGRLRVAGGFGLGIVGISFAALFVRWALPAPPVTTAFYRMLLATAALAALLALRGRRPLPRGRALAQALAAGACFGTDLALWNSGIVRTSLANATFLVNTTPVLVGLASWALLREPPSPRFWGGAALALVGTAALLGADWSGRDALRGDLLSLAAAVFYTGYLLLMKSVRREVDTRPALVAVGAGAAGVLWLYAVVRGDPLSGFPAHSWLAFAGAAGISQLAGVMAVIWSLRFLRATFASLALLGQPVGTSLLAWALLGESLGVAQALGALAVGAGIALASRAAADPALAAYEKRLSSHHG